MLHLSTELSDGLLATNSLKGLLDGGKIYVYSGKVPASADDAVDSASALLVTIDASGSGITFDGSPANGVLKKTASETWTGTIAAAGTATFYRLCVGSDEGSAAAASGDYRVQGTVGTDASFDLFMGSTTLASGDEQPIDSFQLYFGQ